MRIARLIVAATVALLAYAVVASSAPSPYTLRLDGIGPLKLGMSRTAAAATGWLSERTPGCELATPRPVDYHLDGPHAPPSIAGTVEFYRGKLTSVTMFQGVHTAVGVVPDRTSLSGMVRLYKRAGYSASKKFDPVFQATFVSVRRHGKLVMNAIGTGRKVDQIGVPAISVCE